MSAAKKILFSGGAEAANVEGLIESLRKTSPGRIARFEEGGGRIHGEALTDYSKKMTDHDPNASRIMQQKKI